MERDIDPKIVDQMRSVLKKINHWALETESTNVDGTYADAFLETLEAEFGAIYLQEAEKILRELGSRIFLLAVPSAFVEEVYSLDKLHVVLKQTGIQEYPFTLLTISSKDQEVFERFIKEKFGFTYSSNFDNLAICGIAQPRQGTVLANRLAQSREPEYYYNNQRI